ncbi:hypothetical protein EMIT051CA3_40539 [Pseudomonas chlororaphis]
MYQRILLDSILESLKNQWSDVEVRSIAKGAKASKNTCRHFLAPTLLCCGRCARGTFGCAGFL